MTLWVIYFEKHDTLITSNLDSRLIKNFPMLCAVIPSVILSPSSSWRILHHVFLYAPNTFSSLHYFHSRQSWSRLKLWRFGGIEADEPLFHCRKHARTLDRPPRWHRIWHLFMSSKYSALENLDMLHFISK